MDPIQFAQLTLQLFDAAQFPGAAIKQAVAFRDMAERIASGELLIVPRPAEEPAADA